MQENFLIPMICISPPLVYYLERDSLFNFDKMLLGYVKAVIDSPPLSRGAAKGGTLCTCLRVRGGHTVHVPSRAPSGRRGTGAIRDLQAPSAPANSFTPLLCKEA